MIIYLWTISITSVSLFTENILLFVFDSYKPFLIFERFDQPGRAHLCQQTLRNRGGDVGYSFLLDFFPLRFLFLL